MNATGRAFVVLLLLAATVDCVAEDRSNPCNGCSSPHPYTQTSGGTTSSLSADVEVAHEGRVTRLSCSGGGDCTWSGAVIELHATVPQGWLVPDGGDGGETDASADADVPDGPIGAPRGWNARGLVAVVDLGDLDSRPSSALVGARVISCDSRYETLVATEDGGAFACRSGGQRPARVEELTGTLETTTTGAGETTTTTTTVEGVTASGGQVRIASRTETSPYRSWTTQDCY